MVDGCEAEVDDGVEFKRRREMMLPGFEGESAPIVAGVEVRLQQFGQAAYVLFGDAEQEFVPWRTGRKEVVVRDEHGSDPGAHDFEEANAAGARSPGTEDEVRGGEGLGVALLTMLSVGLIEVPVVVGAGVFDQGVGPVELEVEEALAKERSAATLEGEKE